MPHPVSIPGGSVSPELCTFIWSDQANGANVRIAAAPTVRLGRRSVLRITVRQGITVTTAINPFGDVTDGSSQAADDGADVIPIGSESFEAIFYLGLSGLTQVVEADERTTSTLVHGNRLHKDG